MKQTTAVKLDLRNWLPCRQNTPNNGKPVSLVLAFSLPIPAIRHFRGWSENQLIRF